MVLSSCNSKCYPIGVRDNYYRRKARLEIFTVKRIDGTSYCPIPKADDFFFFFLCSSESFCTISKVFLWKISWPSRGDKINCSTVKINVFLFYFFISCDYYFIFFTELQFENGICMFDLIIDKKIFF